MKTKLFLKFISFFIIFPMLLAFITNTYGASNSIQVEYEYNVETNEVTAKIISDIEMKDTKPTWKLSSDKKTYTKVYSSNMNYDTVVETISGEKFNININITQIRTAQLEMQYEYNEETNQVTAKIISDIELKDTKPTWKLSEDKKTFTKIYDINENYTTIVVDKYDNIINIEIKIDQIDRIPPKITVEYKYNDNETVTVYLKSNEKLGNTKPTWSLSTDQKTFQKTYDADHNYYTVVEDARGIQTNVKIDFRFKKFTYNQEDLSTIDVKYLYTDHKKAEVEIISSVQMKNTKPTWNYSNNGYKFTKTYYADEIYGTTIQDINGVEKKVNLIIDISDKYLNGIDVSVHQGTIDWEAIKKTGIDYAIIRCGYGQDMTPQDDKQFARNIAECERLEIPYGIYIYSYALNINHVLSEADHVLRLIKGHNPEFGIWLDLEEDNYKITHGMPTDEMFVEMAIAFSEKIKSNGYNNVGIYANTYWWEYKLNDSRLDKYNKWVAQWSGNCTYSKPYQMWQYTDKGYVNGINGDVDMNIFR